MTDYLTTPKFHVALIFVQKRCAKIKTERKRLFSHRRGNNRPKMNNYIADARGA